MSGLSDSKMAGNLWKMIKYSGRPSTCTTPEMIAKVREVILEDRLSTMFVIALDCHMHHVSAF